MNRDHVLEGILGYFSRLLGMQLLYKFERPQYADVLEENKGELQGVGSSDESELEP